MPGAVPVTSTRALTNATLPYLRRAGRRAAPGRRSPPTPASLAGLNVAAGRLTEEAVARDQGREWTPVAEALEESLTVAA